MLDEVSTKMGAYQNMFISFSQTLSNEDAGIKEGDQIYYDRHAGHKIEVDKDIYHIIKLQDVVVVL